MTEKVFYEDTQTRVTSARIVIGSKTYALDNISSVDLQYRQDSASCFVWGFLLISAFLGVAGLATAFTGGGPIAFFFLITGGVLTWFCINQIRSHKPYYVAILETNAGSIDALSNENKESLVPIVDAINQAVIERAGHS